jgi:arylsulfatase A-like enzyme
MKVVRPINLHPLLALAIAVVLAARAHGDEPADHHAARPNIVFILADDLGFESIGAYGGKEYQNVGPIRTPNLDALAKSGMRFDQCYATPVCSPARSELLTGKYNFRTGFIDIAGRRGAVDKLDQVAHPTLAAKLKEAGYVTAIDGKWHLSGSTNKCGDVPSSPDHDTAFPHLRECGFDRQFIFDGPHLENYGNPHSAKTYPPAVLQQWCLRFLEEQKDSKRPFFLYYASPIPHFPIKPTPLHPDGKGSFADVIEYLDMQVGEIVQKLDALGMREKTLIMFSGDNGTDNPISTVMRDGRVIKGGKHLMLDTGSHVPLLASWPGVIAPGSIYAGMVDFTDIMPTCLELAGTAPPNGLDGISFAPQLQGQPGRQPRTWVHSLFLGQYFVRDAGWKLRENGKLFDVSDAPYSERLIKPENDTIDSKAARTRLRAVMTKLHPEKPVSERQ